MTKADLIERICLTTGFTKKQSAEIAELVFDQMKLALEGGEDIKIAGFGNFEVKEKAARAGRNPQTGEPMEISARRRIGFKPSAVLKKVINREE